MVAGFFQVDGSRFSTGAEWKCSSGSSELSASRQDLALFESKNIYCPDSKKGSIDITAKVNMKQVGKIAFSIDNVAVDIKVNDFSLPYPGLGDYDQLREFDTTLQEGDNVQICGKDDTFGAAYMIGSIYFEGNAIDTDESWICNGKPAVVGSSAADPNKNSWNKNDAGKKIRPTAKRIWDGSSGKIDNVVCCFKVLQKNSSVSMENYINMADLKNNVFIAKKGSKFDLDEKTNDRLVILRSNNVTGQITVDTKTHSLNQISNNIGLKIGSKISIKITNTDATKDLKIAFAVFIKSNGKTFVFYSSRSTTNLKVFETLTQDFGDLVPKNAQFIGSSKNEETINFDLVWSSIKFVIDDYVESLKVNGKDIPFIGENSWNTLRTANLDFFLKSGDKIEICGRNAKNSTNGVNNNDNPAMIIATVRYGNKFISTDLNWKSDDGKAAVEIKHSAYNFIDDLKKNNDIDSAAMPIWGKNKKETSCVEITLPN